MAVVNPYPFAETVAKEGCIPLYDAVENIDIGGSMVRLQRNHKDVTIVVNAHDYDRVIAETDANEQALTLETALRPSYRSFFEHTASYDGMIANYFGTTWFHLSVRTRKVMNLLLKTRASSSHVQPTVRETRHVTVRTATKRQHSPTLKQTLKKRLFLPSPNPR